GRTRTWPISGGLFFERHVVAEPLHAPDQVVENEPLVERIEVDVAEVAIVPTGFEHVVGGDEDFSADGHGGAFGTPAGLQSPVLVLQVAAFFARGAVGGQHQRSGEVHVAGATATAFPLAGTLVVPRAD